MSPSFFLEKEINEGECHTILSVYPIIFPLLMAYAKTSNTAQANKCLEQLRKEQQDSIKNKNSDQQQLFEISLVAENILSDL